MYPAIELIDGVFTRQQLLSRSDNNGVGFVLEGGLNGGGIINMRGDNIGNRTGTGFRGCVLPPP
jgi:hypothetical protein